LRQDKDNRGSEFVETLSNIKTEKCVANAKNQLLLLFFLVVFLVKSSYDFETVFVCDIEELSL